MQEEKSLEPWWFDIKAGKLLADSEKAILDEALPNLYGYHLLQCAPPRFASFVSATLVGHRVLINSAANSNWPCSIIKGDMEMLPILHDSIDVVVLTHTLELAQRPHQMLREAHRILIPEGHVVITGINPFSCWGVLTLIKKLFNRSISEKMISPNRVKDWLKLLDFDITQSSMFYFRPPFSNKSIMDKLSFLEKLGKKFWPFFGGGYAIVAVKRVVRPTPIKPSYEKRQIWSSEGVPGGASFKRDKHKS
jgi:SAM-dependent methyltransferase